MLDLISKYSISEILTFIIIFALAVRGVITFYDWAKARIKKVFNKEKEQEGEMSKTIDIPVNIPLNQSTEEE